MFHQNTDTMRKALRNCARDIVFSYSNSMRFDDIADQFQMRVDPHGAELVKIRTARQPLGDVACDWKCLVVEARQGKTCEIMREGEML